MNSNEIVYERKMTGSFMKLRCDEVKPLDEKILLKNNIPGFLKMEKCYVNMKGSTGMIYPEFSLWKCAASIMI